MGTRTYASRAAGAVALGLVLLASCSKSKGKTAPAETEVAIPQAPPGVQQTKVIVDDKGFTPSHVEVQKGKPASLVFVRMTDDTCAKEVVFPDLKLEKDLPLRTAVNIDIPTSDARTLTFQCGMAMYKSAVVIQ
jgi:plastocyanin domain-containing protein